MNIFREADALAARKLFFPIIIQICRLAGISQYAFASYATVLSLLCIVPLVMEGGSDANRIFQFVMLAIVALMLVYHAMRPAIIRPSRGFWRAFAWAMVALNVLDYIVDDFRPYSLLMWLFMLFGEYALLIGTIPPDETKKRTSSRAVEALRREGE